MRKEMNFFVSFQQTWFIHKVDQICKPIGLEANQKFHSVHKTFWGWIHKKWWKNELKI